MAATRRETVDLEVPSGNDSRTTFRRQTELNVVPPALFRTRTSDSVRANVSLAWETFENFLLLFLAIRPLFWSNSTCEGGVLPFLKVRPFPAGVSPGGVLFTWPGRWTFFFGSSRTIYSLNSFICQRRIFSVADFLYHVLHRGRWDTVFFRGFSNG